MIWILVALAILLAIACVGRLAQGRRVVSLQPRYRMAALAWAERTWPDRDVGQLEQVGDDILAAIVDTNYPGGLDALVAAVDREES
jgi:hypothetical protein